MKNLLAAIASLSLFAAAPACARDVVPEEAIVQVDCATVLGTTSGTATHVGNGLYTTADHVVNQGVCSVGGVLVQNLTHDTAHDFATFSAPPRKTSVRYTCRGFKRGEDYFAAGYPDGLGFLILEAWTATKFKSDGYQVFVGNAYPGMSGGPLINGAGKMVGIVNMRWPTQSMPLRSTILCKGK